MALNTAILTATGTTVIKASSGVLEAVNFGKAGSADTQIDIYDNASTGTGRKLFSGGGTVNSSFALGIVEGVGASLGITVVIAATTAPTVQVSYK